MGLNIKLPFGHPFDQTNPLHLIILARAIDAKAKEEKENGLDEYQNLDRQKSLSLRWLCKQKQPMLKLLHETYASELKMPLDQVPEFAPLKDYAGGVGSGTDDEALAWIYGKFKTEIREMAKIGSDEA